MDADTWVSYFRELCSILDSSSQGTDTVQYGRLLWRLHNTEFKAILRMDRNRIADALELRRAYFQCVPSRPVCMLEMMVSLAQRLEADVMRGTVDYDRTSVWFWSMVSSLGLSHMTDNGYDDAIVDAVLKRFMHRRYSVTGKGGLFTVPDAAVDMRRQEIWYQADLYLNRVLRVEGFMDP